MYKDFFFSFRWSAKYHNVKGCASQWNKFSGYQFSQLEADAAKN